MASESSHSVYYVPEQTKYPFFASIGLFFMVFGLGSLLNDMSAGDSLAVSTWIALAGFLNTGRRLLQGSAVQFHESIGGSEFSFEDKHLKAHF